MGGKGGMGGMGGKGGMGRMGGIGGMGGMGGKGGKSEMGRKIGNGRKWAEFAGFWICMNILPPVLMDESQLIIVGDWSFY